MTDANFTRTLQRLKAALGVITDAEVATMLGLTKEAFSQRKGRNSFPDHDLRALAAKRPELGLDVERILDGARLSQRRSSVLKRKVRVPAAPAVDTHYPTGHPLPQDVIDDMVAHGETTYQEGVTRRTLERIERDKSIALRMRVTGTARELAAARQMYFRGVIFGVQYALTEALLKLPRPANKEQASGEHLLGFDAGLALAGPLLEQHEKAIRGWLRRAAGQRGGRR